MNKAITDDISFLNNSLVLNNMVIATRGLKVKPTYEDLIGAAYSYGSKQIIFPNRDANFSRDGFILSQLDGEGTRQMQVQQEQAIKETFK